MTTIKIQWLQDNHDCETCGWSMAEGANVFFDGELAIELEPAAHCYGGSTYEREAVMRRIIEKLGHSIEEVDL